MDPLVIIPQRTSRRSYKSDPIKADDVTLIRSLLEKNSKGPLGTEIEFKLVTKKGVTTKRLKLGTYGFVQGAQNFIAGQTSPSKEAFLDYGFTLEKIILELTAAGIDTCWLGGTFDRREFGKAIELVEGGVIPAITPVGYATKSRGLGDRIIRAGAGSKRRKNWDELFYDAQKLKPVAADCLGGRAQWLEMLRLAPSASNLQPWRILVSDNKFDLFLNRKPGYQKTFGAVDIQMIDMGIAMSHLQIMAEHDGNSIEWVKDPDHGSIFDWEYIISLKF